MKKNMIKPERLNDKDKPSGANRKHEQLVKGILRKLNWLSMFRIGLTLAEVEQYLPNLLSRRRRIIKELLLKNRCPASSRK